MSLRFLSYLILITLPIRGQPPFDWTVNPHDYQFVMTVTALLQVNNETSADSSNVVAAFVGEECRGVISSNYTLDNWMYFLMVYSNSEGETVTFKAYDAQLDTVLLIEEVLTFSSGEPFGNPDDPFVFHTHTLEADKDLLFPRKFILFQNYPNPFNPATTLRYDLPQRTDVTITIYDILGRHVRTLVRDLEEPGFKSVIWDGRNNIHEQVSAGVYLYQLRAGDFIQTRKMVVLK